MSTAVRNLQPQVLWNHFSDLNEVPRPSKKEERVIQFMVDFGKKLGLETLVDEVGNVIIKKPASAGMEDRQTVVLQSHLDMVHQKNNNTVFDFDKEGIRMLVDGDWVKAEGTTLGADNGIGVAAIMAILSSSDIPHPPVEALFTIDEETGMTGAMGLKGGLLSGDILLNLDTEDDDELTIGCAGGVDVSASGSYETRFDFIGEFTNFEILVKGLTGGHSGMDIHKGRGNANKLMNEILKEAADKFSIMILEIDGGGLRNAIPRESVAVIMIEMDSVFEFEQYIQSKNKAFKEAYKETDPDLEVEVFPYNSIDFEPLSTDFQKKLLQAVEDCHNGVYTMSKEVDGLVQTSNNLARILVKDGKYEILCLTRSSIEEEKFELASKLHEAFRPLGGKVENGGSYPGWAPNPSAPIIKVMSSLYSEMFKDKPHVNACHAGLECGILGTNYPDMDMISFGPNIRGAHSPDEKVQVSSVQKFWDYLLETLKRTPVK
ncbi:MAG: aminoacyl-histidine dipeptidase [Bacteroidia bacterium]